MYVLHEIYKTFEEFNVICLLTAHLLYMFSLLRLGAGRMLRRWIGFCRHVHFHIRISL